MAVQLGVCMPFNANPKPWRIALLVLSSTAPVTCPTAKPMQGANQHLLATSPCAAQQNYPSQPEGIISTYVACFCRVRIGNIGDDGDTGTDLTIGLDRKGDVVVSRRLLKARWKRILRTDCNEILDHCKFNLLFQKIFFTMLHKLSDLLLLALAFTYVNAISSEYEHHWRTLHAATIRGPIKREASIEFSKSAKLVYVDGSKIECSSGIAVSLTNWFRSDSRFTIHWKVCNYSNQFRETFPGSGTRWSLAFFCGMLRFKNHHPRVLRRANIQYWGSKIEESCWKLCHCCPQRMYRRRN